MDSVSRWIITSWPSNKLILSRLARSYRREQCHISGQMGGFMVVSVNAEMGPDNKQRSDSRIEISTKGRVMMDGLHMIWASMA